MSAYDFIEKRFSDANVDLKILKLMEDYATECVKASLEKASENAEVDKEYNIAFVVSESITNPENIILL